MVGDTNGGVGRRTDGDRIFAAGVDIGSLATKSVIVDRHGVVGSSLIPTGAIPEQSGLEVFGKATQAAGLTRDDIRFVVATGYGRISAPYADRTVTEITCHGKGAHFLHPTVRTVLDIGGQDSKAIRVDNDGKVRDFAMNDKCAAGTGRFLELMARVFKLELHEIGPLSLTAQQVHKISSTCSVFAESEVVSLLARGATAENVLAGVHYAVANRVAGLFARVGFEDDIFFSGGVAKNVGVRKAFESVLRKRLFVGADDEDPQLVGALGAALFAREFALARAGAAAEATT